MQRIIKFRVWDLEGKQWIIGPCEYLQFDKVFSLNEGMWYQDDWVFQQFTGLLDKNGKEIYEGDIVKASFPEEEIIREVIYSREYAAFLLGENAMWQGWLENSKIIGNIFETPELLK